MSAPQSPEWRRSLGSRPRSDVGLHGSANRAFADAIFEPIKSGGAVVAEEAAAAAVRAVET